MGPAEETPRTWFSGGWCSWFDLTAALMTALLPQSEPRVRLVMAQHMIRDIQTLLCRMEVSGQVQCASLPPLLPRSAACGEGLLGCSHKACLPDLASYL